MDFRLTDDQTALRRGMRELLAGRFGRDGLRRAADGTEAEAEAVRKALWSELARAGFFSLRLPERDGGAGSGLPEAVLLFEEAGRALAPGPLVASHLAAGLVPGAAEGEAVVTAADFDDRPGPVVEHLAVADQVLCLGPPGTPLAAVPAESLTASAESLRSVDPLTPLHRVRAGARPGARSTQGDADAVRLRRTAALLTAAQQLGSAAATTELAVGHAREREQFGQPIGAFQAVKHLCAQMLVRTETARSVVYAAALTEAESDIPAAVLLADDAAVRNARDCLQVQGGMGFTWEADVHLHLKRAWLRSGQWQTGKEAEEELAAALTGPGRRPGRQLREHSP